MTSHDHHLIHKPDEEGLGDLSVDRLVTVPNVITTIRLGCIPLFLWLLFAKDSPGWAGFVLGVAPALVLPIQNLWMHTAGFTQLALGFACLLLLTLIRPAAAAPPWPTTRAIAWLGTFSYSVYLWHLPWKEWGHGLLIRLLPDAPPGLDLAVYILGAVAVGVTLGKLIEWPVLHLRDRLFPSRSAAAR